MLNADGTLTATRAGALSVACSLPTLGFIDASPSLVTVLPGPASEALAHVAAASIPAGTPVAVSCSVVDAFGNEIQGLVPNLLATPNDPKNQLAAGVGRFERAGRYSIDCALSGVTSVPASLDVTPGAAATLRVARVPDQVSYSPGDAIALNSIVSDQYGNLIPNATLEVQSTPAGTRTASGKFVYSTPGEYQVRTTVTSATLNGVALAETVTILVDDQGPTLICQAPVNAELLNLVPGGHVAFRGSVADSAGVRELRVNGALTPVDATGQFSVELTTRYGLNFVDLVAFDAGDRKTTRSCAFLVADHFTPDGQVLSDSVSFRLGAPAIDDNSRDDIDSVADILNLFLDQGGLREAMHTALVAHPILKSGCDQTLLGDCVLSSDVTYLDTTIAGPSRTHLTLVPSAIGSVTRIENIGVKLGLHGKLADLEYTTEGWVRFESVEVATTLDVGAMNGRPRARVKPASTSTAVGHITTEFPGVAGELLQLAVKLSNELIANIVAAGVEQYVTTQLDTTLDGIASGLGISALGQHLSVARLDGGQPIELTLGAEFSSLNVDADRMLYGMGTRFIGPLALATPTLGAPAASAISPRDSGGTDPVGVAVYEGVFTQGLHALWRAGYFDATLDATNESLAIPTGMQVSIATHLPPIAEIEGDRLRVSLGAIQAQLTSPPLLAAAPMTLGLRASLHVSLANESLTFDDFTLDELHLSVDDPHASALTRALLESVVPQVLEYVVRSAVEQALPKLPIPRLLLPTTLTGHGLAPGSALGLTNAKLSMQSPHLLLKGSADVHP
jgi:hypothetical protein